MNVNLWISRLSGFIQIIMLKFSLYQLKNLKGLIWYYIINNGTNESGENKERRGVYEC